MIISKYLGKIFMVYVMLMSQRRCNKMVSDSFPVIELDDGKIYRKALYLIVKNHGFPVDFPLNQSIDPDIWSISSLFWIHLCIFPGVPWLVLRARILTVWLANDLAAVRRGNRVLLVLPWKIGNWPTQMWSFLNSWGYPQIIHLNRIFALYINHPFCGTLIDGNPHNM